VGGRTTMTVKLTARDPVAVNALPPCRARHPIRTSRTIVARCRVQKHRSGREGVLVNRSTKSIAT
jgi:hypothetical protein